MSGKRFNVAMIGMGFGSELIAGGGMSLSAEDVARDYGYGGG